MKIEHHAFVDGDVGRCGAILRHVEPEVLRTRTVFRMGRDAPVYLVDDVVEHDGDVRRWRRFTHTTPEGRHSATRAADGSVSVDGVPVPALTGAVGAYAEHLLVADVDVARTGSVTYLQLDEADPANDPQPAELRHAGTERTILLDGTSVDAERIELVVAGRPTNVHWRVDGVVVKSDWHGAQSFLVDDLEALAAGLDAEVTDLITEFAARRE